MHLAFVYAICAAKSFILKTTKIYILCSFSYAKNCVFESEIKTNILKLT